MTIEMHEHKPKLIEIVWHGHIQGKPDSTTRNYKCEICGQVTSKRIVDQKELEK